jgi:ADP-ribose pyrophosphatase
MREAKIAAVGIILKDDSVLLIKRKENSKDPWSGDIALPGGRKKDKDKDLFDTVKREIKEEVGLNVEELKFLGELHFFTPRSKRVPKIKVKPFIFLMDKNMEINKGEEIEEIFWANIKEFVKKRMLIKKINSRRQAFLYKDYIIWGLTYRILRELIYNFLDRYSNRL